MPAVHTIYRSHKLHVSKPEIGFKICTAIIKGVNGDYGSN